MTERLDIYDTSGRSRVERPIIGGLILLVESGVLAYAVMMSFLLTALFFLSQGFVDVGVRLGVLVLLPT